MGGRIGQAVLLDLERPVLLGIVQVSAVELVHLVAEEIDLPGTGALVTSERSELRVELGHACTRLAQRAQVDATEPIERSPLLGDPEERLVAVLAVEVDEPLTFVGELTDRCEPSVAVRTRPALARDHSAEHDLGVVDDEASLDRALTRTVAHDAALGSSTNEQLDRVDEQGLACTGLAGERRHAGAEHEHELVDHTQVADSELGQHESAVAPVSDH